MNQLSSNKSFQEFAVLVITIGSFVGMVFLYHLFLPIIYPFTSSYYLIPAGSLRGKRWESFMIISLSLTRLGDKIRKEIKDPTTFYLHIIIISYSEKSVHNSST